MERGFIGLNIAVLAVSEAESIEVDRPSQLAIEQLSSAGHKLVQKTTVGDTAQLIRAKLLEHVADSEVDVVVVIVSMKSDAAGIALDPLITRPLDGFSDLLRMIAYQELGSAAMLIDAEAAQCKSTYVFLVPGTPAVVKLALHKLLLPQLDYRTMPRNLVMGIPRVGHSDDGVVQPVAAVVERGTAPMPAPWITPRTPGDAAVPPALPPRPTAQQPTVTARTSMSISIAQPLPLAKASVNDIVEKASVSVSQRMPVSFETREITNVGAPPPPPPLRGKVNSTLPTPLIHKPPAKLIPLAALLPMPPEPNVEVAPPPAPEPEAPKDAPKIVVDKELSERNVPSRKLDELDEKIAARIAAAACEQVEDEDRPRRYALPPEGRRKKAPWGLLALVAVLFIGATSALVFLMVNRDDRQARVTPDAAVPPQEVVAQKDPAPPPEPVQPPPEVGKPTSEIDMSAPDPNAPPPVTNPPVIASGQPRTPRTPRTPRDPVTTPVRDPADVLATAPVVKNEDGCDEVSCILDKHRQPCCARFRPPEKDPEPVPDKPLSGLPEKLDKLMVQEGMVGVKPAVIACGERSEAKGTVKIQVKVSGSGKVISAAPIATPDDALGACVASAVKLAKFPETDDGGSFAYPFVF
ncbi:MAG: hypothetical protein H0T46_19335 [Deltaproteobacteria bacterium]|nr:hypothetical protein [Deltaproteobacteria bacterium]